MKKTILFPALVLIVSLCMGSFAWAYDDAGYADALIAGGCGTLGDGVDSDGPLNRGPGAGNVNCNPNSADSRLLDNNETNGGDGDGDDTYVAVGEGGGSLYFDSGGSGSGLLGGGANEGGSSTGSGDDSDDELHPINVNPAPEPDYDSGNTNGGQIGGDTRKPESTSGKTTFSGKEAIAALLLPLLDWFDLTCKPWLTDTILPWLIQYWPYLVGAIAFLVFLRIVIRLSIRRRGRKRRA